MGPDHCGKAKGLPVRHIFVEEANTAHSASVLRLSGVHNKTGVPIHSGTPGAIWAAQSSLDPFDPTVAPYPPRGDHSELMTL